MNTIKIILFVALMTFSCQASTLARAKSGEIKPLDQQIHVYINSAPEIKIYDEIIVTVKFRLNVDNKIIVISDNSNNYEIKKLIRTSLNLKKLVIDKKSNNRVYSIPIRFLSTID